MAGNDIQHLKPQQAKLHQSPIAEARYNRGERGN